ncbi:FAD-dependent oxidoreductase [Brevibacterium samyangense]|uniref:FAD-dependent oxidoreductase n=1 Tax=Brevibacterium samyangense TaxID=366888 RepID=A0ABN2T6B7_9MICO
MTRSVARSPVWKERARSGPAGSGMTLPAAPVHPEAPAGEALRAEVVVIGAGLTGLVTAHLLVRAGVDVLVLEAGGIGNLASGATTAKSTVLQGARHHEIAEALGVDTARAHLRAHVRGQEWLRGFCSAHGVPIERVPAFTVATGSGSAGDRATASVQDEYAFLRDAFLHDPVLAAYGEAYGDAGGPEAGTAPPCTGPAAGLHLRTDADTPLGRGTTIELPAQDAFDPLDVLEALADTVVAGGGRLGYGVRVSGMDRDGEVVALRTDREGTDRDEGSGAVEVQAGQVVLATGSPVFDRGRTVAQLVARRSYLCAFEYDGDLPGMYLGVGPDSRSLRTATVAGKRYLLVGGEGHRTGDEAHPRVRPQELEAWTARAFPDAQLTHAWSAQDLHPAGLVPMAEVLPGWGGRVHWAGGYAKWGMTAAPAAALRTVDRILGLPEEVTFGSPPGARTAVRALGAALAAPRALARQAGDVRVGRAAIGPACPHMGFPLTWNDAECSWDCALHGSRFTRDGARIEGPTGDDLRVGR